MTTQAQTPTHKQDKFKQFKTAANRILRHDDDSGDTHDALFLAGHLSPDIVQMIESDQKLIAEQAAEIARLKGRAVIEKDAYGREVHNLRRALDNIRGYADTLERAKSLAADSLKENDADCHNRLVVLDEFDAKASEAI